MAQERFALLPRGVVFEIFFRVGPIAERETVVIVGAVCKSEHARRVLDEIKRPSYLLHSLLLGGTNDVRVGEAERADTLQSHELSRLLVAVELREFRDSHRQFAIAVRLREVEFEMMRAGHRSEHELLVVNHDRRVHAVFVVGVVAALPVEIELRDIGGNHVLVAAAHLLVNDPALELAAHGGTFWEPEGETLADGVGESEELQFAA